MLAKMVKTIAICISFLFVSVAVHPALCQSKRPVLIRDTDKAEGKEEPEVEKPKEYNPLLAEKSFKVGDFYFKRKNFRGAIERYLEALEYQPEFRKALPALERAFPRAIEEERAYLKKNPDAPDFAERKEKLAKLEQQYASFKSSRKPLP